MKEVKSIVSLSYGSIACNAALIGIIVYNTNPSDKNDTIASIIAGFGLIISILYAVQLIRIKSSYHRHVAITAGARVFLHIFRIIQLLYSLMAAFLLTATVYNDAKNPSPFYMRTYEYKFMTVLALILVTVVINLTIFFKGWRLLKLVKRPYIEEVMASFD